MGKSGKRRLLSGGRGTPETPMEAQLTRFRGGETQLYNTTETQTLIQITNEHKKEQKRESN